jgi:drug/metabolite transporter (DMT)-like permease
LLLPLAFHRGAHRDVRGRWLWVVAFTAVEIAVPWYLLTTAEEHLTSSLSGLLVAAVPLVGVLLARFLGHAEVMTLRRWAGLVVGFAGVAFLVGLQFGDVDMAAVGEVIAVAVCYAIGPFVLSQRLADVPSLSVITAALSLTTIVYVPFAIATHPHHVGTKPLLSLIALGIVCTAIGFLVFFALIAEAGPTRATVITFVNPAVAIIGGVTVLGEDLTAGMIVGFPLVLAGSFFATSRAPEPAVDEPSGLSEEHPVSLG